MMPTYRFQRKLVFGSLLFLSDTNITETELYPSKNKKQSIKFDCFASIILFIYLNIIVLKMV